jgi:hypothetical protein
VSNDPLRQLLYASICPRDVDFDTILHQSRHNNAVDGITGLLWYHAGRVLQVLEGPDTSVAATFARIVADPRHSDVRIVADRTIPDREFGYWSMERGTGTIDTALRERLARRLDKAPADVREAFAGVVAGE